jgi:DNA helicase-2/ATP-dependent DNA helicase PcrA
VLRLDENYRSSPQILTVADAVLGLGRRALGPLKPHRPDGPLPTITSFPSDLDEARGVALAVRDRHSTRLPWSAMAVLARTNAQALLFEEAFRAAQVPFRVRGSVPFLALPEVRTALDVLRAAPAGSQLAARLGDLDDLVAEARSAATGGRGAEAVADRAANLEGLVRLAGEFLAAEPSGSVAAFLSWLSATITSAADEPDRSGDVVEITTFHKAKGLEWPVVFVTGLERGFVPIAQADGTDEWDEERRLLYVAVTRAEHELHCTWAQSRTFGARTTNRSASPWLANVEAAIAALRDPSTGDWRSHLRAQRERLAAAKAAEVPGTRGTRYATVQVGSNADPKVLEALKRWRLTTARATGVPAFVILHDTTLAAVAEARPTDRSGLLALPGMGPVKVDRYGDGILAVVAETARAS